MTVTSAFSVPEYSCVDDLIRDVFKCLLCTDDRFDATKGPGADMLGVSFRLMDPRARLSRSEMRGKVFSALGELLWYLSGSARLDFIRYYIPAYTEESSDDGGVTIHGAYGPRIFRPDGLNQIQSVVNLLKEQPDSRRAVIQLFSAEDLRKRYNDIPCTCTLQAIVRKERLNLLVHMRSNDAYLGLPHDIFAFTMLQEMIARSLGFDVGFYQHIVGNLHLYERDIRSAEDYLSEGYQSILPMPAMPMGDPWPALPALLRAEAAIRDDPRCTLEDKLDPFWEDILRLLRVYSENQHKIQGYKDRIGRIKTEMSSNVYDLYIA